MRILVLASTYPRFRNDHEPIFVQKLCQELTQEFEVDVLVPHAPDIPLTERQDGVNIYRYRYAPQSLERLAYDGGILMNLKRRKWTLFLVPFFILGQFIAAAKLLRANSYTAIHAHWIIPQGLVAILLKIVLRKDIPVLLTSHGGDLFGLRAKPLQMIKQWVVRRSAHLTVVSGAMQSYCVEELDIDASMITVRSMGVDLVKTFTPAGSVTARQGLIFVGRLVEKKGVEYLIKAMPLILKSHPDIHLTVVGEGPLKHKLEVLVESLKVSDHVHFAGGIPNDHLPALLREHEIAVVPSVIASGGDQEGLGLVAVEALGCECAVVVSDLPALRDVVVEGETGLLANPGDPVSLAEKIVSLLDNRSYARKLAVSGRKRVSEIFDWSVIGHDYVKIIKELR